MVEVRVRYASMRQKRKSAISLDRGRHIGRLGWRIDLMRGSLCEDRRWPLLVQRYFVPPPPRFSLSPPRTSGEPGVRRTPQIGFRKPQNIQSDRLVLRPKYGFGWREKPAGRYFKA